MFMMALGLAGAALCVVAYTLVIAERIDACGYLFSIMNGIGGVCLLIAIAADYDSGDTGGVVVEACWIMVSIYGVTKAKKKGKLNE